MILQTGVTDKKRWTRQVVKPRKRLGSFPVIGRSQGRKVFSPRFVFNANAM
jgi:hypothetical protein